MHYESFRTAESLAWHAWTVFDGDQPGGDGNVDGQLVARDHTGRTVASTPLDIFTPIDHSAPESTLGATGLTESLAYIIADPETTQAAAEQIRQWCRTELGRDDVTVTF